MEIITSFAASVESRFRMVANIIILFAQGIALSAIRLRLIGVTSIKVDIRYTSAKPRSGAATSLTATAM